jgi:hypothetical protein
MRVGRDKHQALALSVLLKRVRGPEQDEMEVVKDVMREGVKT